MPSSTFTILHFDGQVEASDFHRLADAMSQQNCLLHTLSLRCCEVGNAHCQLLAKALEANPIERLTVAGDNKRKVQIEQESAIALIRVSLVTLFVFCLAPTCKVFKSISFWHLCD